MMMWRTVVQGKLVHPEFDKHHHVSTSRLVPVPGAQVEIGFDTSGIHPACAISQTIGGQLRVYLILYGKNMGFDEFVGQVMLPFLNAEFPDTNRLAACDPANARMQETATSPTQKLQNEYHVTAFTAGKTNAFNVRKRAVANILSRHNGCIIDGTRADNEYVVNKQFVEGMSATYIHKRLKGVFDANGDPVYSNEPHSKADNSHGIDAFQYLCVFRTAQGSDEPVAGDRKMRVVKKKRLI
jgi:hypothetical protein